MPNNHPDYTKFTIGVDVGIASCGIAILNNVDQTSESFTYGFSTAKLAIDRREKRSGRKNNKRKRGRIKAANKVFDEYNILEGKKRSGNIFTLKVMALDNKISPCNLRLICAHSVKYRGVNYDVSEETEGVILVALSNNATLGGYRTISEHITKGSEWKNSKNCRNSGGTDKPYEKTYTVKQKIDELRLIFAMQREKGNSAATVEIEEKIVAIMSYYKSNPNDYYPVGDCCYIESEKRTAEDSPSNQLLNAYCYLRNLKKPCGSGLAEFEISSVIDHSLKTKSGTTLKKLKKLVGLQEDEVFNNYAAPVERYVVVFAAYHAIKEVLSESQFNVLSVKDMDRIVEKLAVCTGRVVKERDLKALGFDVEIIEPLLGLNFSGHCSKSLMSIWQLLPLVESGKTLSEAEKFLGMYENVSTEETKIPGIDPDDIRNPVARRGVCRCIKYINLHIKRILRDNPTANFTIRIEFARDVRMSEADRVDHNRQQAKNEKENSGRRVAFTNEFKREPKGKDMLRFRLWQEQGGYTGKKNERCGTDIYTGKDIKVEEIERCEIDHIIPRALGGGNGLNNKTLTMVNQAKGKTLPLAFIKQYDNEDLYKSRCKKIIKDKNKLRNLLTEELPKREFTAGDLCATQYISRFLTAHIKKHTVHRVECTNGRVTSTLRWILNERKNRDDIYHHVVDAMLIAIATAGQFNRCLRYYSDEIKWHNILPWAGFSEQINEAKKSAVVIREERKRKSGRLHKETIYPSFKTRLNKKFEKYKKGVKAVKNSVYMKKYKDYENKIVGMVDINGVIVKYDSALASPDTKILFPHNIIELKNGIVLPDEQFRLDVFKKGNKYFFVNHTIWDINSRNTPNNKILKAKFPSSILSEVDDTYTFVCSLYKDSLFEFEEKNGNRGRAYFNCINIATISITVKPYNNMKGNNRFSLTSAKNITKLYISSSGEVNKAKNEVRKWRGEPC